MRWYSVKDHLIPANNGLVFVALEVDDMCVYKMASYKFNSKTDEFSWFDENGNTFSQITHFCIPEPVEREE